MNTSPKINELEQKRTSLRHGGGDERIRKQHEAEKLTARERLDLLLDRNSFQEVGLFAQHRATLFGMAGKEHPADGVVTGTGRVDGRVIQIASQDFTVAGGSAGEVHCDKIAEMQRVSLKTGTPFVFINDSGGARVQEGVVSLAGYARVFYQNVILSGVVPQISLICGPCAGGAAYSPALADFIIQTRYAQMFITGPSVIKQVTGEIVTADELGGAYAQMSYSGVVHFVADDDAHAIQICKRLLSFLPSNNIEDPLHVHNPEPLAADESLNSIVPNDPKASYDMHEIILRIVDRQDFLEVQEDFASNLLIGFGRLQGRTIGIVANQPAVLAGALDINASDKCARFIRFCNAFNIPLVTFVDVPGFLPGVEQE
jgi:methylmalonyl-CoA carboxyltransferase large subunit